MRAKVKQNTPEEETTIQRDSEQNPDNPERGVEWFANARPAREVLPPELYAALTAPRRRGPGRKPPKAQVTFRLDQDVIDGLRASGPGWQVRANDALRRLVRERG